MDTTATAEIHTNELSVDPEITINIYMLIQRRNTV